jgi:ComF family protein
MDKREALRRIRDVIRAGVDIILPPTDSFRQTEKAWQDVKYLDEPCCVQCGFPFEYSVGEGVQCAACLTRPPRYSQARSALVYDDASRPLILAFKHSGKTEHLSRFAAQLSRVGRSMMDGADMIIPVPLHNHRLITRRFNQSALLARRLSKISQVDFQPDILRRIKATPSQAGKSASGRRRNVRGAFQIAEAYKKEGRSQEVKGKHIILIDDVMTTGSTVEACASVLLKAGAKRVDVLCLARVIRADIHQTDSL